MADDWNNYDLSVPSDFDHLVQLNVKISPLY